MTTISCPRCGQRFAVDPHLYGKRVACTACQAPLDIPDPTQTVAPVQTATAVPFQTPNAFPAQPHAHVQATSYPTHSIQKRPSSGTNVWVIVACVIGGIAVILVIAAIGITAVWQTIQDRPETVQNIPASSARRNMTASPLPPAEAESTPPVVPDRFVFRPTFATTEGTAAAGQAFAVDLPDKPIPIVLTAIHLLGPAGGLDRDIPSTRVPKVVERVSLKECFDRSINFNIGGHALAIPSAAPLGEPSTAGDIAAFWVPPTNEVTPLPLASADPQEGDPVWLAGPVISGAPSDRRLHAAQVVTKKDGKLYYAYENSAIELRATSGAPVLNARGEVVAINLGGGELRGDLIGVGNPVSRFRPHLLQAASNPPQAEVASVATDSTTSPRANAPVSRPSSSPGTPIEDPFVPSRNSASTAGAATRSSPRSVARPPAGRPNPGGAVLTLESRKSIYHEVQGIGRTYRNGLQARDRAHARMLESMKNRPSGRMLENMTKMHENAKEQLTRVHERSIENLAKRHRITLDQLAEIIAEGDREGWPAPGRDSSP